MKIISPSFKIMDPIDSEKIMDSLELYGRVCYKSESSINKVNNSFLGNIIANGHESVIEHEKVTVTVTCDRGVSHEIVRHRIASYSQESTRYCNYMKDKFGNELTFIKPCFWTEEDDKYILWKNQMQEIENTYFCLLRSGASPEEARAILPNSLKTDIVITMNLREWRHFFRLRTSRRSHPQMREISIPLLCEMTKLLPVIFGDIVPM